MIFSFFHKIFVLGWKKKDNKLNSSSCVQSELATTTTTGPDQNDRDLKGRGFIISENEDDSLEVFYLRNLEDGRRAAITYLPRQENLLMYARGNSNNNRPPISKPTPKMSPQENAPNSVSPSLAQTTKQPPLYLLPPMKRIPLPPPSPPLPPPPHPHYLQPPMKRRIPLPPPPPPLPPRFKVNDASLSVEQHQSKTVRIHRKETSAKKKDNIQTKLKPLHWDKVAVDNADHSMVWDDINIDGSLRIDDDLMKALFGYSFPDQIVSTSTNPNCGCPNTQIFILDPRKSQNAAIIIRSLNVSQREIIDALFDGQGLSVDILEKLVKICPTKDEEDKLIQFNGNPSKLANAESFLYHILKSVPSAFARLNSMLFKSSYDNDILHVKESLQTLETACKELRTRGIFFKLLEAILKTGNLMNAGTSRGNAQGFNLNSLRKLSSIKSTDGKTSLLHFVVEQVIYSEEKSSSHCKETDENYMTISRRLHSDFSNVKKASSLDYYYYNMCPNLKRRVDEIKLLVKQCCQDDRRGCFGEEMKGFVEKCEEELTIVKEEETRIMLLVKRTTEYYQVSGGDSGTKSLQLFVMVKDFINMVDQVCLDISSKLEKKKMKKKATKIDEATSLPLTQLIRLQNLKKPYFTEVRPAGIVVSTESDEDDLLSF